jgi:hypothetical protein
MYNETYRPLEGERLADILNGLTEEEQAIAKEQVDKATESKTRNYRVTIVPKSEYDDGMWFDVENGIVIGSQDLGRN